MRRFETNDWGGTNGRAKAPESNHQYIEEKNA